MYIFITGVLSYCYTLFLSYGVLMFKFSKPILLSAIVFFQGCGSGSSPKEETTPLDQEYHFSISSSYTNACGTQIPVNAIELILQDDKWGKIESYYANENGDITFTTTSEYINYTIVAKDIGENEEVSGLEIASFYHTFAGNDYQYSSPYAPNGASQNCHCVSQNLVLRHRSFASITQASSSLPYQSLESIDDQTTQFNQVEACREDGSDWSIATFTVIGVDGEGNAIGAGDFLTNFDSNEEETWHLAAVEVAASEMLTEQHDSFSHVQLFSSGQHFYTEVEADVAQTLVFEDHSYASESEYFSKSIQLLKSTDSVFGSSSYESSHQKISTRSQDVFDVEAIKSAPALDDSFYSEISSDGSYDYSEVSHYPMAVIAFEYIAYSPITEQRVPVKWTSYGQASGLLPSSVSLTDYQNIINQDNDVYNTEVTLLRSLESDDYQDYLNFYQGIDTNDFDHNLLSYTLTLSIN